MPAHAAPASLRAHLRHLSTGPERVTGVPGDARRPAMMGANSRSQTHAHALANRRAIGIANCAASLLLLLSWPLAAAAQRSGEAWDDSHMQSNSARRFDPSPPRPPIRGSNRFEQSASAPTEAPPTTVPETTLHISQHEWAPGGPSGSSSGASRSSSRGSSSFGGISGGAAPSVSSGISRSSSGSRSSSLRSTSSGSERGRRR